MYEHVSVMLAKFEHDVNIASRMLKEHFSLDDVTGAMKEASLTESWLVKRFCDNQAQLELRGENYEIDDIYEGYLNRSNYFSSLERWNELFGIYIKRCKEEFEKEKKNG